MDITDLRKQIDKIDDALVQLFVQRMHVSGQVAEYKKHHNLPIHVPAREDEILKKVSKQAGADLEPYIRALYTTLFELSRSYQGKNIEVDK